MSISRIYNFDNYSSNASLVRAPLMTSKVVNSLENNAQIIVTSKVHRKNFYPLNMQQSNVASHTVDLIKLKNLQLLYELSTLPQNWDDQDAEEIDKDSIKIARDVIISLNHQLSISPTPTGNIIFESNFGEKHITIEVFNQFAEVLILENSKLESLFHYKICENIAQEVNQLVEKLLNDRSAWIVW